MKIKKKVKKKNLKKKKTKNWIVLFDTVNEIDKVEEELEFPEKPRFLKELRLTKEGNLMLSDQQQKQGLKSCSASLSSTVCSNSSILNTETSPFNMQIWPNIVFIKQFSKEPKRRTSYKKDVLKSSKEHVSSEKSSPMKNQSKLSNSQKNTLNQQKNMKIFSKFQSFLQEIRFSDHPININQEILDSQFDSLINNKRYNHFLENNKTSFNVKKNAVFISEKKICCVSLHNQNLYVIDDKNCLSSYKINENFTKIVQSKNLHSVSDFTGLNDISFSNNCQKLAGVSQKKILKIFSVDQNFLLTCIQTEKEVDQVFLSPFHPFLVSVLHRNSNTLDFYSLDGFLNGSLRINAKFLFTFKLPSSFHHLNDCFDSFHDRNKIYKASWSSDCQFFSIYNKNHIFSFNLFNKEFVPKTVSLDQEITQLVFLSRQKTRTSPQFFFVLTSTEVLMFNLDTTNVICTLKFPSEYKFESILSDPLEKRNLFAYDSQKKTLFFYFVEENREKFSFHLFCKIQLSNENSFPPLSQQSKEQSCFVSIGTDNHSKCINVHHHEYSFLVPLFSNSSIL